MIDDAVNTRTTRKANKLKASGIAAKQTVLEKHLVPVLGKKRLNEIGDYEVQKVKRHLAAMKPKTVNCVLTVLSKLLKVAVDWKELASMPVSVKMVKAPDPELPFYDSRSSSSSSRAPARQGQAAWLSCSSRARRDCAAGRSPPP